MLTILAILIGWSILYHVMEAIARVVFKPFCDWLDKMYE